MSTVINILGTFYEIRTKVDPAADKWLDNTAGYHDSLQSKIVIADRRLLRDGDKLTSGEIAKLESRTLRHEIVHAYLYESGLSVESWAENEELVDWLALQIPKIIKTFDEVDE